MIRWDDRSTDILLNPRLGATDRAAILRLIGSAPVRGGHVWLTTSGSSGRLKPVALAKDALLAAADAVNQVLGATREDVWCRPLPAFHVGGLSIHARAFLSASKVVVLDRWDPAAFVDLLEAKSVTLTSLVPAQLRDVCASRLGCASRLRVLLLGGGTAPPDLLAAAKGLGWPVTPTYGSTETSAAVALGDPLTLLPHVEARGTGGRLAFRGPSLFTGYATARGLEDPKQDGWWVSDDLGTVTGRTVTVTGRAGDVIKIGGESVSLAALQAIVEGLLPESGAQDAAVRAVPDARLGLVIKLEVVGSREDAKDLHQRYDQRVLPFERAREVEVVERIERTELGKLRATGRI